MPKLTLTAESDVINKAKQLAEQRGTSVSAMFSDLVKTMARSDDMIDRPLPPITRRLAGIVKLPPDKPYRELIEEALWERYGR